MVSQGRHAWAAPGCTGSVLRPGRLRLWTSAARRSSWPGARRRPCEDALRTWEKKEKGRPEALGLGASGFCLFVLFVLFDVCALTEAPVLRKS